MTEKMEEDGGGRVVVGYALPEKKVESFITPSLLAVAHQHRINLIPIDLTKPLVNQGPFHCIIHKLYSPEWNQQLHDYSSRNPSVPVIDPPHAVRRLHDRVSMLRVVSDIHRSFPSVGIPNQICVQNAADLADLNNLDFPVIAKAMLSNGTDNSHQMYLILNRRGLRELKMEAPFVLQQFVNHGGVLFKVYVAGEHVRCVTRNSLPDCAINPEEDDDSRPGVIPFSQISNLRTGGGGGDASGEVREGGGHGAEEGVGAESVQLRCDEGEEEEQQQQWGGEILHHRHQLLPGVCEAAKL